MTARKARCHRIRSPRLQHAANALALGGEDGVLVRNVADAVEPPRYERKEMRASGRAGVAACCEQPNDRLPSRHRGRDRHGLRRGELLGLRWTDIDLVARRLTVRRSSKRSRGSRDQTTQDRAQRANHCASALRRRRLRDELARCEALPYASAMTPGCSGEPTGSVGAGAFSLAFARFVKNVKLPHVRFHDLRHSFGTLASHRASISRPFRAHSDTNRPRSPPHLRPRHSSAPGRCCGAYRRDARNGRRKCPCETETPVEARYVRATTVPRATADKEKRP